MKKTRILFVVLQLDAGGSERIVFELARSLDPEKFEVYVAAFKDGVLTESLRKICKEVHFIEKTQGLDILAMFRLANIVKKYSIDVVNAHHYMPCFYSFLATKLLNNIRLIYTEHSVPEVESIANCFHGKIFQWMLYRINAVVGVSKAITEKFIQKYPRHVNKFHEIVNGVDIGKFREQIDRDEVRSRWGLAKDHFVVGTVANYRKIKNHACLVRAVGHLKDSHTQLRLLLVGTGFSADSENSEGDVRALICKLGLLDRVVLAGYQENIPDILPAFDAFCLPSFSEGLPVSLLEAMAAGVLVIGSDVNGIKEVISSGETGLLFSSNNDKELSLLIENIIANRSLRESLSINALKYIINNHNYMYWLSNYSKVLSL